MYRSFILQTKLAVVLLAFSFTAAAQPSARSASKPADQAEVKFPSASQFANTRLTSKIIDAPNSTYGYEIYADGRLMIRQASVPAMPGNEGFKTKKGAQDVAALVIEKIKKGQMPPTVEIDEMKKLKAIH